MRTLKGNWRARGVSPPVVLSLFSILELLVLHEPGDSRSSLAKHNRGLAPSG